MAAMRPFEFRTPPKRVAVGLLADVEEYRASVPRAYSPDKEAEFFLLKGVLPESDVAAIVAAASKVLSASIATGRSREPEPADGRPRFAVDMAERGAFREDLRHVLEPFVEDIMLPYVRRRFACPRASLSAAVFRRFAPEERRALPAHHEHDAVAVCVLGLQDPSAFSGGLFLEPGAPPPAPGARERRRLVPVGRGDACLYGSDLCRGVDVQEGTRLELALLFKDSPGAVAEGICPWHLPAAEAGDPGAQLGWALSLAGRRDFSAAEAWLEKPCAQGHPEALFHRASWAWEPPDGSGLEADTVKALQFLRRAAELGHARSQSRLGGLLVTGVKGRVQQDTWEGKRLLRLAFEQDDVDAGFILGRCLLQEGDRDGVAKVLAASARGHPRACFQIAELYREGSYGFPKDVPASLRYTKWAAHQGDAQALSNLGNVLVNGWGAVRDDAKAVRLFRHAARLGASEGMLNYGLALLRGSGGVKVDYQEALKWARQAAVEGNALAQQQLPIFFNAAKQPNPPAKCVPRSLEEIRRLGVRDLRDLLHSEGVDFSDCVEKSELVARAASHFLRTPEEEPWDAAPEHTLLLEPPKKSRIDLQKQQQQQQAAAAPMAPTAAPAPAPAPRPPAPAQCGLGREKAEFELVD